GDFVSALGEGPRGLGAGEPASDDGDVHSGGSAGGALRAPRLRGAIFAAFADRFLVADFAPRGRGAREAGRRAFADFGALPRSAMRRTASSSGKVAGSAPLGSEALSSPCFTYGPYRPSNSSTGSLSDGCLPISRSGVACPR